MELSHVCGHLKALSIGPWAYANAVLGINSARALRGEIGMPSLAAGSSGGRESLAMPISTGEPAKITTITEPDTRNKKAHRTLLCAQGYACAEQQ
jgi:hypothetical protein